MINENVYTAYIYISIVDVHVTCTVCIIDCSRLLTLSRSILVRQSFGSNLLQLAEAEADKEKGPLQQFCEDLHNKRRLQLLFRHVWALFSQGMDTKLV